MTVLESDIGALRAQIAGRAHLTALVDTVLEVWPEHAAYLKQSFAVRSAPLLATSDEMAAVVLTLAGGRARQVAEDYRWLCGQLQDEELFFARNDRYRYSSFAETNAHVYANDEFMTRYMNGLLFSHVLWFMHLSSLHFYRGRLGARLREGGRVLEVGSGHGLLLYLALSDLKQADATAWDLSQVSLEQTRHALELLNAPGRTRFAIQDMHTAEPSGEPFDLVILSHLLEHLDNPVDALQRLKRVIAKDGCLFVNVPLNAPMPDHIVLLRTPEEALQIIADGGFRVLEHAAHTTQNLTLPRALKRQVAVTCSIIAQPV